MDNKVNELKALIKKVWDNRYQGEHGWFKKDENSWLTITPSDSDDEDVLFLEEVSKIDSLGYPMGPVLKYEILYFEDVSDDVPLDRICEKMLRKGKKKWTIPVTWEMCGTVEVEADTLEEALKIARDDEGEIPLPEGEYVDSSWRLSYDDPEDTRHYFNNDQPDD